MRCLLACCPLFLLSPSCNEAPIDPSDAAILETLVDAPILETTDTTEPAHLTVTSVETRLDGLSATICLIGDGLLDQASVVAHFGDTAVTPAFDGNCFVVQATLPHGKHSLRVSASAGGTPLEALWLPLWVAAESFDWRRALLYMVMVDRFRDSDQHAEPVADVPALSNYQGGDLGGVVQAIEAGYFAELGVDALWLTPVLDNAEGGFIGKDGIHLYSGYHGYWIIDPTRLESRLAPLGQSPEDALHELVATAHDHGLRVVLDAVLNHVHEQHPYCSSLGFCRRTCVCGEPGCDWEARARDCQFASYLLDLDLVQPGALARVTEDLLDFVRAYDLDGLRLDAVKHMDEAVLSAVRAPLDRLELAGAAPFWLVGESFTGGDGRAILTASLGPGELHGLFDFPLYWTIRDTFVNGGSFRALEAAVTSGELAYGDHLALMSPFLGNHDVERMATALAHNDLGPWGGTIDGLALTTGDTPSRWDIINPMSMAMAFLLTLRGVPLIFQGDELGLGGSNDPDNRRLLPVAMTADQAEIARRVRELGIARRQHPALAIGARRELWLDDDLYVQARWLPGETMIVAMNKGLGRTVSVTLPPALEASGKTFQNVLSARRLTAVGDQLELALAPWEYLILKVE